MRGFDAELHTGWWVMRIFDLTGEALLATNSYHGVQVNTFVAKDTEWLISHRMFDADPGLAPWRDLLKERSAKPVPKK